MKKDIMIGEAPVRINTSAGWLFVYRETFGHDILVDLMPAIDSVLDAAAAFLDGGKSGVLTGKDLAAFISAGSLHDAIWKMAGLETTTILQILWALAYNEDKSIGQPMEFFNSFEAFPVDEILPELFTAVVESSVSSKNAKRLLSLIGGLRRTPSASTPSV